MARQASILIEKKKETAAKNKNERHIGYIDMKIQKLRNAISKLESQKRLLSRE